MPFRPLQTSSEPPPPSSAQKQRLALAMERVAMMLDCFPDRTDAPQSAGHAGGLAAILSDYPDAVILAVTDPRTGVQTRQKWRPLPYELKQACEAEMAPLRRQWQRERLTAESARLLSAPREPKPTVEELKARFGEDWGITRTPPREPPRKSLEQLQAEAAEPIHVSDELKRIIAERAPKGTAT